MNERQNLDIILGGGESDTKSEISRFKRFSSKSRDLLNI